MAKNFFSHYAQELSKLRKVFEKLLKIWVSNCSVKTSITKRIASKTLSLAFFRKKKTEDPESSDEP